MPAVAVSNMLELVGGTPLVRLRHLVGRAITADIFCKCEQFNPGGSVKDRIALSMIEAAEREGRIRPGQSVIVEPTSGNTGIGLALVCAPSRATSSSSRCPSRCRSSAARCSRPTAPSCILTPAADGDGRRGRARRGAVRENPNYFMPQQFNNPANPEVHRRTTAPEILAQLGDARLRRVRAGVGTGGTITGVGQVLARQAPERAHRRRRAGDVGRALGRQGRAAPHRRHRRRLRAAHPRSLRHHDIRTIAEARRLDDEGRAGAARGPARRHLVRRVACKSRSTSPRARPRQDRRHDPVRHGRALLLVGRVL